MEILTTIRDLLLKLPTPLVLSTWVVITGMLLAPEQYAAVFGIDLFRDKYRIYLGPVSLFIFAILLSRIFSWICKKLKKYNIHKQIRRNLEELTADEKGYLACFVEEGRTSIYVDIIDGVAGSLVSKGIIFAQSNAFDMVNGIAYGIQPVALKHLKSKPDLLTGAKGKPQSPIEKLRSRY